MRYYAALVHKDAESGFGVSFPDFPGCVTAGSTLEEVASMAAEALAGHIELMIDEGIPIPEPTDLDTVMADPENRSGVPVMVPAIVRKLPKVVRVNITMPADVLEQIDRYADRHGYNRSGFFVQAAKKVMESDAA